MGDAGIGGRMTRDGACESGEFVTCLVTNLVAAKSWPIVLLEQRLH
jgi:hypothetical protein